MYLRFKTRFCLALKACKKWKHCCVKFHICKQYRHKTIKNGSIMINMQNIFCLTQCELSKVSFHQKFCIYVPRFFIINFICSTCCSYRSLDLTNYICYSHPANIRFSWPTKTSGWSRRMKTLIFTSCSTLSTSSTTPIHHFSSYLHATCSFRRTVSMLIPSKSVHRIKICFSR